MQGMEGKESSDKGTFPESACHAVKEPEEEQCAEDMQDKVGQMIPAGIQAVKLIVEHQGQPGQRMPELCIGCAERPANSIQCNSGLDVTVLGDIYKVINIDEGILIDLPENSKCDNSKNEINDQFLFIGADIYFI